MILPEQHTRILAADPIQVGDLRLLPSVLVDTKSERWSEQGLFNKVSIRPVSIVVESPDGARWHEIPNTASDEISRMMAVAGGIAVVSILMMALIRWVRHT